MAMATIVGHSPSYPRVSPGWSTPELHPSLRPQGVLRPHPQACREPCGLGHSESLPPCITPGLEAHPSVLPTQAPVSPETTSHSHFFPSSWRSAGGQLEVSWKSAVRSEPHADTKRGAMWGIPGMVLNKALKVVNGLPCF